MTGIINDVVDMYGGDLFPHITFGQVVDTNDPQQMGRLRVLCPALNDTPDKKLKNLPWATYASPFAGMVEKGSRGRGEDRTVGPVAYGMWNIPKVGTTVLVACIDGDPSRRIWLGCIHNQLLTHTMPHGRFSYRDELVLQSGFEWEGDEEGKPLGPFSSQEERIEPTFTHLDAAFTPKRDTVGASTLDLTSQVNFEWRTRGADHSVSGVKDEILNSPSSNTSFLRDDADTNDGNNDSYVEPDGNTVSPDRVDQGYKESRIEPGLEFDTTVKNYDSQVYSWTTPGFHAIAMDDASTNCRMRFRTTHGHQIILDDTNERIYISTAGGKTWIEMDEAGNLDFYAERNISFHSEKDINFTTNETFRVKADKGIHMASEGEIRVHSSGDDVHVNSDKNVRIHAGEEMRLQSIGNLHIRTEADSFVTSVGNMDVLAEGSTLKVTASTGEVRILSALDGKFTSDATLHLKGATDVNIDGGTTVNVKSTSVNIEGSAVANVKSGTAVNVDGGLVNVKSGAALNAEAGGVMALNAPTINLNSGGSAGPANGAGSATAADTAIAAMTTIHKNAFWTNRIPEHEPWPRVMTQETGPFGTDNDGPAAPSNNDLNTHSGAAEYNYDDENVGRIERGEDLNRNENWHR